MSICKYKLQLVFVAFRVVAKKVLLGKVATLDIFPSNETRVSGSGLKVLCIVPCYFIYGTPICLAEWLIKGYSHPAGAHSFVKLGDGSDV